MLEHPFAPPQCKHVGQIGGISIYITTDYSKQQLSPSVCEVLTPEFIAETNAWMRDFFGVYNVLQDGQALLMFNGTALVMNPRTFRKVQTEMITNMIHKMTDAVNQLGASAAKAEAATHEFIEQLTRRK